MRDHSVHWFRLLLSIQIVCRNYIDPVVSQVFANAQHRPPIVHNACFVLLTYIKIILDQCVQRTCKNAIKGVRVVPAITVDIGASGNYWEDLILACFVHEVDDVPDVADDLCKTVLL